MPLNASFSNDMITRSGDLVSECATSVDYSIHADAATAHPLVLLQAVDRDQQVVALGGEGCQLSVWDLTTQVKSWQAKGGKPNRVGLVDKADLTAVAHIEGGSSAAASSHTRWLVGTAAGKLLLYDSAAGRRPQLELQWGAARVTALAAEADGEQRGGMWAVAGYECALSR